MMPYPALKGRRLIIMVSSATKGLGDGLFIVGLLWAWALWVWVLWVWVLWGWML
ncbi:hypothetical protein VV869_00070 [Photobacterium sp. MCCC 1A19761]|uniref:hypothetical protein n=1 Tax=Photobacterium sp. MCCC 1A19761 TaxID=3115000 RepID=UPI00307D6B1B